MDLNQGKSKPNYLNQSIEIIKEEKQAAPRKT